ncbi:hypothetical protein [Paenibacillus sp. MDMC362]|uniref:hypothetical protein n=1 Tax=Paenibacillus sp. MDMC362 TaxID=2977365 RepID=UPI000DC4F544|nr:hypothetical protein [Paenibacillus sp. MDMC362]RAR44267.1 hypothetical protein DP091_09630 [Paenibacillus sp. MDMC362]
MKKIHLFSLILVILLLSACQSSEQLKPIKEETIDFDINTAIEMVEKKEKMIIDLALREKVSKLEYKELEKSFTEEFGGHAKEILSILFIHNLDSDPESDMYVQQNTLYPTLFHEGITITNAVVYKSYFENEFFNQTRLSIEEKYVGDDEKLKDWKREYIFTPNKNGEWELNGFSGVMNFLGEDYNMNYLELKR